MSAEQPVDPTIVEASQQAVPPVAPARSEVAETGQRESAPADVESSRSSGASAEVFGVAAKFDACLIRRVAVRDFRHLRALEITGLAPGLNVLAGDNEEGKSTLFDAIRAALFQKHGLTGKGLDAMQPWGSQVSPEVELDLNLDGQPCQLSKRFGKQSTARFESPLGRFEGAAAEEELARRLGFSVPSRGNAQDEHLGIWSLLLVEQGRADALRVVPDARETLHGVLGNQVGEIIGGPRLRALRQRIDREYARYWTPTGREAGELKVASETLKTAIDDDRRAGLALQDVRDRMERLQKMVRERNELYAAHRERGLRDALNAATERAQAALDARGKVERRRQDVELHAIERQRIEQNVESRLAQRQSLESARAALVALLEEQERTTVELQHAQAQRDSSAASVQQLERRHAALQRTAERQALRTRIDEARQQVTRLEQRQRQAQTARDALREHRDQAARLSWDATALASLQQLDSAAREARATLSGIATTIEFQAFDSITRDDLSVEVGVPIELVEEAEFVIATGAAQAPSGRVRIRPGGERLAALRRERDTAEAARSAALERWNVASMAQAEARDREWRQLHDAIRQIEARLEGYVPDGFDPLESDLERARVQIDSLHMALQRLGDVAAHDASTHSHAGPTHGSDSAIPRDEPDPANEAAVALGADVPDSPSATAAAESLAATSSGSTDASTDMAMLESRCVVAREERDALEARCETLHRQREILRARSDDQRQHADDIEQQCAEAEQQAPLDTLQTRLADAANLERLAMQQLDDARRACDAADPDGTAAEQEQRRLALERFRGDRERLDHAIAQAQGELTGLGQQGHGEAAAAAAEALRTARRQHARVALDAAAVRRLREVLDDAEQTVRARFLAPLMQRIQPMLQRLLPDAELSFNEDLEITGLTRASPDEPFAALSLGTREQLAIISRLAFAELLAEQGRPVIVVLDDALAYADPDRFERMQQILLRSARRVQILLLTCRPSDYVALGAPMHALRDARPNETRTA